MNNQIPVILCINVELEPQRPDSESGVLSVSVPAGIPSSKGSHN